MKNLFILFLSLFALNLSAQEKNIEKKITITGKLIDKESLQPLEYATVTVINTATNKPISGAITDLKGDFNLQVRPGNFILKYEYLSFKTLTIASKGYFTDSNLGAIALTADAKTLNEVVVRAEKTNVDIKLDKKVFSIGKDILVRGGTVSDVLDNVPSVSVSPEGAVALRGNENVRILIDGKPANANSINDALKMLSADSVDKVEVVTNPSARYDAEGGGGIINIILKKGKNQGVNGTLIVSGGYPENSSISANLNVKKELFNFFTTVGYNKRKNPGYTLINQENLNPNGSLKSYLEERRDSQKFGEGLNLNFGIELNLDKNTSWTHAFNYRNNDGGNLEDVRYYNNDQNKIYSYTTQRLNDAVNSNSNVEYTTNWIKKFKKEGHKLSIDGAFGKELETETSTINGQNLTTNQFISLENTRKKIAQGRNLLQLDYVYPFGKNSQFEAGFRGNYLNSLQDFQVQSYNLGTNTFSNLSEFTNIFNYVENVNALYTQVGSKIGKFSYLLGLRYEDSHIEVNLSSTNQYKTKNYNNFFPSAFLTYQIKQNTSISANYSKRITRPRDRFINPFASYTSNINYLKGNPDINPACTDAFDLGFLRKWDQFTLNASAYFNHTTDAFQLVRKETGQVVGNTAVITNTFFNLGQEDKTGLEFTLNYSPKKWLTLNANFNYFNSKTKGDYTYINSKNESIYKNFDYETQSWNSRLTSKVILPFKINWQTNISYNADQKNAQGTMKGILAANLGFSKDILKDMATVSFNVSDVFNSRKRIQDLSLPTVNSYSEMQNRRRQFTISFTYRFNKKRSEKEAPKPQKSQNSENDDMIGG